MARLENDDLHQAAAIIEALRPADQADLFGELDPAAQGALLPQIEIEAALDSPPEDLPGLSARPNGRIKRASVGSAGAISLA